MSEQILINITPQETRVAVMQQGVVQELHIERASSYGMVGNIYQGRVCRVLLPSRPRFYDAKTRSGKIMRRLLRDIAEGKVLGDTTTLADPGVVEKLKTRYGEEGV